MYVTFVTTCKGCLTINEVIYNVEYKNYQVREETLLET